jgi:ABC-type branched-subunit amino acid transport system substrate-binding protein
MRGGTLKNKTLGIAVSKRVVVALLSASMALGTSVVLGVSSGSVAGASAKVTSTCSGIPKGPIKIADILPLSGPTAQLATHDYLVDSVPYFNAHGGICGHPLKVVTFNDEGNPALALSEARQVVSEGITIMNNDSTGPPQDAIQPYLMEHHVLVFNSDATVSLLNPKNDPTAFAYEPSSPEYASLMVNWAKSHNLTNIGLLNDGTTFSQALTADVQADLTKAGIHLSEVINYSSSTTDLTPELTQAKEDGVQTLMTAGYTAISYLVSGLTQIAWSPPILSWGILSVYGTKASAVPPGTVDGCLARYEPGKPTSQLLTPTVIKLLQISQAKIGRGPETADILEVYNGLLALRIAITKANSLNGSKVAAALETIRNMPSDFPGVKFTFTKSNHTGIPPTGMAECTLTPGPYGILNAAS